MPDALLGALLDLLNETGPGGRIPPERELADRLGASRTAIRHRLRQLESAGTIDRRGAAGTFVRTMVPSDVAQLLRLGLAASPLGSGESFHTIRVALERQAAKEAARQYLPIPIAHAEAAVLAMAATTEPDALYQADIAFHRSLFHASGDAALIFFAEAISDLLAESVAVRQSRILARQCDATEMARLHQPIVDALKARDSAAAMAAVDWHFDQHERALQANELE